MPTSDAPVSVQLFTAADLDRCLREEQRLFVLDVRNEEDALRWPIEGRRVEVLNVPYFVFLEDEAAAIARLPRDREIVVVCAKGGASEYVAALLQAQGLASISLRDGMAGWGNYYGVREVVSAPYGRIVQISRPARGDLSFVAVSDGQAAVIDPLRHVEHYLRLVAEADAAITHVFDTHAHADHLSGGPVLARRSGARYFLHPYDGIHPFDMLPARMPYEALEDGQRYRVGQFDVEVIWFPGHTLGQVNFLFRAPNGDSFLFTGDGLFLRSFGRPDLGGKGETWTDLLYESLFERLPRRVSDDALILPAHFSTMDEGDPGGRFAAPLSRVRQTNEDFSQRSRASFKEFVVSHLPPFPPQYVEIKRANLGLVVPTEEQADELEMGKNVCALAQEPAH